MKREICFMKAPWRQNSTWTQLQSSGWAYFLEKNSSILREKFSSYEKISLHKALAVPIHKALLCLFIRQKQSLGKSSYEKIKSDWLYTCRNLFPYMDFYGYTPIDSSIFKEIFFLKEKYQEKSFLIKRKSSLFKEKFFNIKREILSQ